jgi:hypothetical protein
LAEALVDAEGFEDLEGGERVRGGEEEAVVVQHTLRIRTKIWTDVTRM